MVFDKQGLSGVRVKWVFDEFFSSMIAGDYDRNHNNRFENNEIKTIKDKAFANLANYAYFTFIKVDGRPFKVKYVRDFSATLTKSKLTYRFFIPCHVKAASSFKNMRISQYDPTYYTRVAFGKTRPVSFEGNSRFEIHFRLAKNLKEAYYFGQIHPHEIILKFRQKNG